MARERTREERLARLRHAALLRQLAREEAEYRRKLQAEAAARTEQIQAETKARQEKIEAEAKARREQIQAEAKARQEEIEAEAKARREQIQTEAKARQEEIEAEAKARREQREAEAAERRRELDEQDAMLTKRLKEAAEARRREAAERERKFDRRINQLSGSEDNRWGRLVEALVEGDLVDLLQGAGVAVEELDGRVRVRRATGENREYDFIARGPADAVVVEVKTTLRPEDVRWFLQRMGEFRQWAPRDARDSVWGALAYLTAEDGVVKMAERAGFYLIQAVGPNARVVNTEGFRPRPF